MSMVPDEVFAWVSLLERTSGMRVRATCAGFELVDEDGRVWGQVRASGDAMADVTLLGERWARDVLLATAERDGEAMA